VSDTENTHPVLPLPLPHPRLSIRLWTIKNPRNQAQRRSTSCSSIPIEHERDPVTPAAHSYIPPFRRISPSPSFLYNRQPSHPPDPNRPIRTLPNKLIPILAYSRRRPSPVLGKMASLVLLLSLLAIVLSATVSAEDVTVFSMAHVPDWQMKSIMTLSITAPGGDAVPLQFELYPLTRSMGLNESDRTRKVRIWNSGSATRCRAYIVYRISVGLSC